VDALRESLGRGKIDPVYVLVGEETFLVGEWLDAIRDAVVGREGDLWNSETIEGAGSSAERILGAARTLPMMGPRRLVVVRQADALEADDQAAIAEYLPAPSPTTTLVLVATKLDARGKLAAAAVRTKCLHKAEALKDRDAGGFVSARAADRGLRLEPRAASALVEALGADMAALDDAIERLGLFVGTPARPITAQDVAACVSPHKETTFFALTDALSVGDAKAALETLGRLVRDREPGLLILWWLSRQIRQVGVARTLGTAGEIASTLGVHPFVAEKLARSSKSWTDAAVRQALVLLAQADLDLKGSKVPEDLLLEALVLGLVRKRTTKASARPA
jgi:DNA polymerase-3 subunit delta